MSDNILVGVKIRPFISREKRESLRPQWTTQEKVIFQIDEDGHRLGEPYSFDHIFLQDTTNANVYMAVVEPLVKSFLNGFNSTIFAYGQTSSGKTHTMMGNGDTAGIIQMAITDIFKHVSQDSLRRYLISCSYFEIYNEKINDLLDKNGQDLKIREDYYGNVFVNAKEEVVATQAQVLDLMKVGSKIRKIGCTNMNERSSRSHTIFRFTIKSTENNIEHGPVQISQLNLVDLAGSERIAHTKAAGVRLKEGVNINKSLLALGNVIRQLSEGERFINYRDSNLTRLLQHALGGNAKSLIIATITVAAGEETKSTLEFAQRAKVIKNKPIINEILSEQDKLKQYELVTANYKDRLEKEKLRILEMEQEKEEREKEISKLKQQVKMIDLFTNGPESKKTESKIPRRHTMGHYSSRIPLQTIPESRILQSNIPEKPIGSCDTKLIFDDDALFLKTASEASDYDYMKMVIEESLEERILSVTPEPSEDLMIVEETTPMSHLRERLQHLEQSYTSLREFTKFEAEYKDKNVVSELIEEKENLLKDLVDLNAILKETRQENEHIKMTLEEKLNTLKRTLEHHEKTHDEFVLALEQAEAEKDALKLLKEQLLNDKEFLLEQQKLKYEKQIEYYIKEIELLHNQQRERDKVNSDFEAEIKRLKEENEFCKQDYEEKIKKHEEQLQKYGKDEENVGILSTSTQTEETEWTSEIQRKDDIIFELKTKVENLVTINNKYLEESKAYKKENDVKTHEIIHQSERLGHLETEIEMYQKELDSNARKMEEQKKIIGNLEKDMEEKIHQVERLGPLETEIDMYQKELEYNARKMEEQKQIISNLEKDRDEKIHQVERLGPLETLIDMYQKELESNSRKIEEQKQIISNLEKDMDEKTHQVKRLGLLEPEINMYQKELESNARKIEEQKQIICNLEKDMDEKILELNEDLTKVETENNCYKKENVFLKNEIGIKDDEIKNLESKYENILETRENLILELKKQIEDLEQLNKNYKKELEIKEDHAKKLQMHIDNYKEEVSIKQVQITTQENQIKEKNRKYDEDICSRDNQISHLTAEIKDLQSQNNDYKTDIQCKDNQIAAYLKQVKDLEENIATYKQKIWIKDDHITKLSNKIEYLEKHGEDFQPEIKMMENQVLDLINQIKHLETVNGSIKLEIKTKNKQISELTSNLKNLENLSLNEKEINQTKDKKISELERSNDCNVETIKKKDNVIMELNKRIKELETVINLRDGEIFESNVAMHNLKEEIIRLKADVQSRGVMINELNCKIDKLARDCRDYEKDISKCKEEISLQERKIKDLTESAANKELQQTEQDSRKEDNIQDLNKIIANLLLEKKKAAKLMDDLMIETETKRGKIQELDNKMRSLYIENTGLRNRIFELENLATELKSLSYLNKLEIPSRPNSTASTSSAELSPKEVRRRKRQSIHDERRGIDLTATTSTEDDMAEASPKDLTKEISSLRRQVEHLTDENENLQLEVQAATCTAETCSHQKDLSKEINSLNKKVADLTFENESLESEVQGFIGVLEDYKNYNKESDDEIELLKAQIDKLKNEICKDCLQKERMIKKLEELQKQNKFKIVELQTKIYDLRNNEREEKSKTEERDRQMQYHIQELEKRLGDNPLPEVKDKVIQCDVMNYQQLLEKYSNTKKLARMRRDEGNKLRARLGMNPDEPV